MHLKADFNNRFSLLYVEHISISLSCNHDFINLLWKFTSFIHPYLVCFTSRLIWHFDQVSIRLISQLINGISRVLQKLFGFLMAPSLRPLWLYQQFYFQSNHQLLLLFLNWYFWSSFKCTCSKLLCMINKFLAVFTN